MFVKELIKALSTLDPNVEVGIASVPSVDGWVNGVEGLSVDERDRVVIWATLDTLDLEEVDLGKMTSVPLVDLPVFAG